MDEVSGGKVTCPQRPDRVCPSCRGCPTGCRTRATENCTSSWSECVLYLLIFLHIRSWRACS